MAPGVALQAAAQQAGGTTLRVAITQQIDTLNPFIAIFQSSTELGRLMYEFLTTFDTHNQPTPGLAEKWETSADKLTWTYTIRQGAKWSDGQPITAKDVVFTYNLMMTNADAATANGNFVANFESVTAPDEHTVVIKTKVPVTTMTAMEVPIVPEHVWASVSDIATYANDTTPVVGSGPFVLTEYKANEYIKLKANKDYWRGPAKYDELQFVYYKNADAAVQALQKGEVDLVNRLAPAQFDSLKNDPNIVPNQAKGRRFNELLINPGAATKDGQPIGDGHPALKDVRVRQAIAKAIDVTTIVNKVMGGYAEPATGLIPTMWGDYHWQPAAGQERKFDPAAANADLDAAGYPKGADGTRVGPDGRALTLRLLGHSGRAFDEQTAEYVKRWLSDIGIGVEVQLVSDNQFNETSTAGNFDLQVSTWGSNPDPDYILSLHTCAQRPNPDGKGGTTDSFFCDAEYDALYAQQSAEFDRTKRAELVRKMQQRLYEQAPLVMLDYDNALEGYRKDRFDGFQKQPAQDGVIMAQSSYWGYYSATPVAATSAGAGSSTGLVIGVVVVVVVVLAGGGLLVARRRGSTADERE
ncbi:ABC transporter substrate-binding protein [Goodfellowiella coeruleoviolacea]|uniref:Peptide/nickel transport system substrate-binding protein n=1 Tax=Goodfellowiella coeruleoviolacea TaxID=334858 RepID=A0AAE3GHP2_9PSEU|nr:peptide/nickel transport system substrate-binding protein [Goodfellowiella coeruleoviolacea]